MANDIANLTGASSARYYTSALNMEGGWGAGRVTACYWRRRHCPHTAPNAIAFSHFKLQMLKRNQYRSITDSDCLGDRRAYFVLSVPWNYPQSQPQFDNCTHRNCLSSSATWNVSSAWLVFLKTMLKNIANRGPHGSPWENQKGKKKMSVSGSSKQDWACESACLNGALQRCEAQTHSFDHPAFVFSF